MRISLAKLRTSTDPGLIDYIIAQAVNNGRSLLTAAALVDNSTGVVGSALVPVATQDAKVGQSGANLGSRADFNAAMASFDNIAAVLAAFFNLNVFSKFGTPQLSGMSGTVAVAGTIPAMPKTVSAVDGSGVTNASDVLTFTGQPVAGETVTAGGKTYTYQAALTNVDGNVLIGANLAASITNLVNAIGLGAGSGATYAAATTANNGVTAAGSATTVTVTSKAIGPLGNGAAVAETVGAATWASATLSGGSAGNGILRAEVNAALSRARNNLSHLIKAYNIAATALGVPTLNDLTGGKAAFTMTIYPVVTAGSDVAAAGVATGDLAAKASIDPALNALANNVAFIANRVNTLLLTNATLSAKVPAVLVP